MELSIPTNNKFRRISEYALIIILFLVVLSIRECKHNSHINKLVGEITRYNDSAKYYKDKHKNVIAYNGVLEFQTKKTLDAYLASNKSLKDVIKSYKSVSSVAEIKTTTLIHDTVLIPFETPIPCNFKPIKIIHNEPDLYRFDGIISNKGFLLDSIQIFNTQSVIVGNKKVGFLRHENRVEVINSNHLINTINIGSYVVNPEKRWYEKPFVTFGIGVATGFVLNSATGYFIRR
jgi:hypothetical protein